MCYSAMVWADYMKYIRVVDAEMDWFEFVKLYGDRKQQRLNFPKAMDAAFANPRNEHEQQIRTLIDEYNREQVTKLEQEIFAQRKRLADAERTLQTKTTKKALEDQRISSKKVEWAMGKLADIRRSEPKPKDSRIFPGWYAPVLVMENGRRVIKPMRYQCRPIGKPANYDFKYPGTYNARRDNLEHFWKDLFGYSHGIMVMDAFYENVSRHNVERRELAPGEKEENVILEFRPNPPQPMFVACLWSHWRQGDEELLSFAAITDEPPAEVAAAGHDRCVIPIKPENIDAWLSPDPKNLAAMQAILDDRDRPYYEHRMAA